jgi:hypothetical protein
MAPNKPALSGKRVTRAHNPTPFHERRYCSKREAVRQGGPGRRKIDQMISEGRIETIVVVFRRYIVVQSLLRALEAGSNVQLPEPPQLARAKAPLREQEGA